MAMADNILPFFSLAHRLPCISVVCKCVCVFDILLHRLKQRNALAFDAITIRKKICFWLKRHLLAVWDLDKLTNVNFFSSPYDLTNRRSRWEQREISCKMLIRKESFIHHEHFKCIFERSIRGIPFHFHHQCNSPMVNMFFSSHPPSMRRVSIVAYDIYVKRNSFSSGVWQNLGWCYKFILQIIILNHRINFTK